MKDLFNHWKQLPKEVIDLIDKFNKNYNYKKLLKGLESLGHTCEVGLDNVPYNLRKINS